jgi:hypothetical protein
MSKVLSANVRLGLYCLRVQHTLPQSVTSAVSYCNGHTTSATTFSITIFSRMHFCCRGSYHVLSVILLSVLLVGLPCWVSFWGRVLFNLMVRVILLIVVLASVVFLSVILQSVVLFSIILQNVFLLSVIILSVVHLSVFLLSVILLSVVLLNVIAPQSLVILRNLFLLRLSLVLNWNLSSRWIEWKERFRLDK